MDALGSGINITHRYDVNTMAPGVATNPFQLAFGSASRVVVSVTGSGSTVPVEVFLDSFTGTMRDPSANGPGSVSAGLSAVLLPGSGGPMVNTAFLDLDTASSPTPTAFGFLDSNTTFTVCTGSIDCVDFTALGIPLFTASLNSGENNTLESNVFGDIFTDGFESGDTSAWSSSSPNSAVFRIVSTDPNAQFTIISPVPSTNLVSAVLPGSRSVQVGIAATAFGTIINAGSQTAIGCSIAPITAVPASFLYQTTDPATNALTGTANTPVDIAAGASQSYVFAFTPTAAFAPTDVQLTFGCTNTDPAPITSGLNTLLLSASSIPIPDIVADAVTVDGDGIVKLASTGIFAVATVNVGVAGTITVSADTGSATLPVSVALCETNPATGVCINPTVPTSAPVTTSIAANATPTFAFFVTGTASVPFDPANNRIFVRFRDVGGDTRGSTSVAVQTL